MVVETLRLFGNGLRKVQIADFLGMSLDGVRLVINDAIAAIRKDQADDDATWSGIEALGV